MTWDNWGRDGIREWEFIAFPVNSDEAEEGTIEQMEADGWEHVATVDDRNSTDPAWVFVVFKRRDGVTQKRPKFPVWQLQAGDMRTARDKQGTKMTDRDKLGKRARR